MDPEVCEIELKGRDKMTNINFINKEYKKEWIEFVPNTDNTVRYCEGTAAADDGVDFAQRMKDGF